MMPIAAHIPAGIAKRKRSGTPWTRARALSDRRRRARLADGLERAVAASQTPPTPWTTAIPVQSAEVQATRTLMLELASRIRAADDAPATAFILVRRLLTDGSGPLFASAAPGRLRDAVVEAILALENGGPRAH
jgi:hypothetical protein